VLAYDGGVVGQGESLSQGSTRPYLRSRFSGLSREKIAEVFATSPKQQRSRTYANVGATGRD